MNGTSGLHALERNRAAQAMQMNAACGSLVDDTSSTVSSIGDDFFSHHDGASANANANANAAAAAAPVLKRTVSSNALEHIGASITSLQRAFSSNNLARMHNSFTEESASGSNRSGVGERGEANNAGANRRESFLRPTLRGMVTGENQPPEELMTEELMYSQEEDGTFSDMLSEAEHYLAMSMLVYMYAKLREMSVLGYTSVDFRAIDPNSYLPWVPEGGTTESFANGHVPDYASGVDLDDSSCRSLLQSSMSHASMKHVSYLLNTKTARFIIRTVLGELEREKNAVKEGGKSIESNHDHDISIIKEFRHWVEDSRSEQMNDAAEAAIVDLRRKVARARWKRAISAVRRKVMARRLSGFNGPVYCPKQEDDFRQCQRAAAALGGGMNTRTSIREALQEKRGRMARRGSVVGGSFTMQHRLVRDHFGLGRSSPDYGAGEQDHGDGNMPPPPGLTCSAGDIITDDMVNEAMDNSLPKYFRKGSVLNHMVESGIEVAWFGDRHPNEAIFCICICRKSKMVTIIFRGSVTAHNWSHNMKVMMSEKANPLASETYEGRKDSIWLHTGFSLYLLKKRRDCGRRKIDEIFDKVRKIGRELSPDGRYSVSVAGHSLGGALATIFSFFAATVEEFTTVAPVRTFTFASPRVGDKGFLDAYRQLERTQRVLHARFAASGDIVPLMPTHTFTTEDMEIAKLYKHVGLQVRLNETTTLGNYKTKKALDVTYALIDDPWSNLQMFWKNSFIMNLNTISGFGKAHFLSTYQRRLHFARQYRLGLGLSDYFADQRRRKLKSLEEYYEIKTKSPQQTNLFDLLNERQRHNLKMALIFSAFLFLFFLAFTVISSRTISSETALSVSPQNGTRADPATGATPAIEMTLNESSLPRNESSLPEHSNQTLRDLDARDFMSQLEEDLRISNKCLHADDSVGDDLVRVVQKRPRMGAGAWGTRSTPAFMYRLDQ